MKNFHGKIIIIITIYFFSCSPCSEHNIRDFERKMTLMNYVKDVIVGNSLFKEKNFVEPDTLKTMISIAEYHTLEKLNLRSITKWKDVILFKFSSKKDLNYYEKLGENTDHKTCNNYLFYSTDKVQRYEYANFERYAECRTAFKDIGDHWTYVSQIWYCAD